jgi:hypothetical protein
VEENLKEGSGGGREGAGGAGGREKVLRGKRGALFEGLGTYTRRERERESQARGSPGLRGQLGKSECVGGQQARWARGEGERAGFLAAFVLDGGSWITGAGK